MFAGHDRLARLDFERDACASVFQSTVADPDRRALLRVLFRGVRDNDFAALLVGFGVDANDDSIVERSDSHKRRLPTHGPD